MSFIETIIHWEISPEELRKIADQMDKQKSDARPGETRKKYEQALHILKGGN